MGIFSRKKAAAPAPVSPQSGEALARIEPLDMGQFPSATDEQASTMEQVWATVVSQSEAAGSTPSRSRMP